ILPGPCGVFVCALDIAGRLRKDNRQLFANTIPESTAKSQLLFSCLVPSKDSLACPDLCSPTPKLYGELRFVAPRPNSSRLCQTTSHTRSEEHTSELQSRGHLVCR